MNRQFARTEAGKAASSQNSLKHGLASGTLLIAGEDPAGYDALVADFIRQHHPQTPGEEIAINADKQMDTMSVIKIPLMVEAFRDRANPD